MEAEEDLPHSHNLGAGVKTGSQLAGLYFLDFIRWNRDKADEHIEKYPISEV